MSGERSIGVACRPREIAAAAWTTLALSYWQAEHHSPQLGAFKVESKAARIPVASAARNNKTEHRCYTQRVARANIGSSEGAPGATMAHCRGNGTETEDHHRPDHRLENTTTERRSREEKHI